MISESEEHPFELEITDSIDLHAFAPDETRAVTVAYLEEAVRKGFTVVRIIHGKGVGVQREIVRSVLADLNFVASFKNAPEFSGGSGATVVSLNPLGPTKG